MSLPALAVRSSPTPFEELEDLRSLDAPFPSSWLNNDNICPCEGNNSSCSTIEKAKVTELRIEETVWGDSVHGEVAGNGSSRLSHNYHLL